MEKTKEQIKIDIINSLIKAKDILKKDDWKNICSIIREVCDKN